MTSIWWAKGMEMYGIIKAVVPYRALLLLSLTGKSERHAMDELRQVRRRPIIVKRVCSLGVITFKQLEWGDHDAQVVDISRSGVGIESDHRIEPGFVWFRERVGGHKGGVLMWSRQRGDKYRSGIKFVPLSHDEEQYVQERVASTAHRPLRKPEEIISTLLESIKKGSA